MSIRATNNTIVGTPCFEVQRRLSRLGCDGEAIETKEFGTVRVGSTVTYTNVPGTNKMAWLTVSSVGPGAAWMAGKYRLDRWLKAGDVIGFDASQYVDVSRDGAQLMLLPVDAALCRFNPSDEMPVPLGVYFMSVPDEAAARRFAMGKKLQATGFVLTNDARAGEIRITDNPNSKVRYSVERVVGVGGGGMTLGQGGQQALGDTRAYCTVTADGKVVRIRTREPVEIVPEPEAVGMVAVFGNAMSVSVNVHGARVSFTNWDRVRILATDDTDTPELGQSLESTGT